MSRTVIKLKGLKVQKYKSEKVKKFDDCHPDPTEGG